MQLSRGLEKVPPQAPSCPAFPEGHWGVENPSRPGDGSKRSSGGRLLQIAKGSRAPKWMLKLEEPLALLGPALRPPASLAGSGVQVHGPPLSLSGEKARRRPGPGPRGPSPIRPLLLTGGKQAGPLKNKARGSEKGHRRRSPASACTSGFPRRLGSVRAQRRWNAVNDSSAPGGAPAPHTPARSQRSRDLAARCRPRGRRFLHASVSATFPPRDPASDARGTHGRQCFPSNIGLDFRGLIFKRWHTSQGGDLDAPCTPQARDPGGAVKQN